MNFNPRKKTALVVDDDIGIRMVMNKLLTGAGFHVKEASSAAEGLQLCDEGIPSVILLDVQLPDFSGFEVCQRLRRYYTKQELPILMVTGSSESEDVAYSFTVGANDFVAKPIDKVIFLARVENQVAIAEAQRELEAGRQNIARALDVQRTMGDELSQAIAIEDTNGTIVYSNKIFTAWAVDIEQRVMQTSFEWLFAGELRNDLYALWQDVHVEQKTVHKVELKGKKKIIECTCKEIPSRNASKLWLWVLNDITEQRSLEEAASHRVKYDSLGLFSAGVAHNFNNLLTGILGATEVLTRVVGENERGQRCLKIIKKSVDEGRTFTRKLSAMLRKSGGDRGVVHDVNQSIETVIACYQEAAGERIEFLNHVPDGLPSMRIADANFIDVIANLVANAVDAIEGAGSVEISATLAPGGDKIIFAITDTGRGITREDQPRLFEPFYSTKMLDTKNGVSCSGNGLGLWTVYSLVKASEGHVSISSTPGKGTTVTVEIPVVRELGDESHLDS